MNAETKETEETQANRQEVCGAAEHQHHLSVLAKSPFKDIQDLWSAMALEHPHNHPYTVVKPAEVGMMMVRAQAGTGGEVFNAGEMTVTRCVVQRGGIIGVGYTAGRSKQKAELIALIDLYLQDVEFCDLVVARLIKPLEANIKQRKATQTHKTNQTKVDFFTMVRGES